MKKLLLIALLATSGYTTTISGNAKFCRVDNEGWMYQCYYYSLSSCRMFLPMGYFCAMNPNK